MDRPLPPRESARFVAERSHDVAVDGAGVRRAAELLLAAASGPALRVDGWRALHELNPRAADEAALGWVFVVDTLNFSFWAEREERRCLVRYGGKTHSGYWALCAAVNRALDEGGGRRGAEGRGRRGSAAAGGTQARGRAVVGQEPVRASEREGGPFAHPCAVLQRRVVHSRCA